MTDPYKVLGVGRGASSNDIKKAFHRKALKMHPDKAGNTPEVVEEFQKLQMCYSVLSDETKRNRYDRTGNLEKADSNTPSPASFSLDEFLAQMFGFAGFGGYGGFYDDDDDDYDYMYEDDGYLYEEDDDYFDADDQGDDDYYVDEDELYEAYLRTNGFVPGKRRSCGNPHCRGCNPFVPRRNHNNNNNNKNTPKKPSFFDESSDDDDDDDDDGEGMTPSKAARRRNKKKNTQKKLAAKKTRDSVIIEDEAMTNAANAFFTNAFGCNREQFWARGGFSAAKEHIIEKMVWFVHELGFETMLQIIGVRGMLELGEHFAVEVDWAAETEYKYVPLSAHDIHMYRSSDLRNWDFPDEPKLNTGGGKAKSGGGGGGGKSSKKKKKKK